MAPKFARRETHCLLHGEINEKLIILKLPLDFFSKISMMKILQMKIIQE